LSEVEFPEMTAREFPIGPATALALRRSTADLPAWELLIPSDTAVAAYEAVCRAGKSLDLRHAGAYMSESLRLENGTPSWGRDVSRLETPFETGLDALVQPDKQVPFVGQESLLQLRGQRPKKRLVRFVLDGVGAWPQGREPIWRDGTCVGHVTTAAFGHSIGKMLAFGYVSAKGAAVDDGFIFDGRYEIEIADRRFAAIVATQ
jgi:4-methylaminobutanoate oxidase (formaldehyde-forming)